MIFFFFFSSRRRHTRLTCDWSSDVCSSDLVICSKNSTAPIPATGAAPGRGLAWPSPKGLSRRRAAPFRCAIVPTGRARSEERRVGKECRSGWWACDLQKKENVNVEREGRQC